MVQLEKSLFDGGASPHDIALVMSTAAKKGSLYPLTPGKVKPFYRLGYSKIMRTPAA